MKGETVEELSGLLRSMLAASPSGCELPTATDVIDIVRHRRRPAATRSTCRRSPRSWSPAPAAGCASTATGPRRRRAGRPTCSRRSASPSSSGRPAWPAASSEAGIGFCFAPRFHPAMRHAGPTRRELGVPTVFNFLGPLANPARARRQVVGVSDPAMAEQMAGVLAGQRRRAGAGRPRPRRPRRAHHDHRVDRGRARRRRGAHATPSTRSRSASAPASLADLRGGDAAANAGLARRVLAGEPGPTATSSCSTPRPASWSPASPTTWPTGVERGPRRRSTTAGPPAALDRLVDESVAARTEGLYDGGGYRPACQAGSGRAGEGGSRPASASMVRSSARAASRASSWRASSSMAVPWLAEAGRGVAAPRSSSDSRDTSRSTSSTCSARWRRASVRSRGARRATMGRWWSIDTRLGFELVGQLGGARQLAAGGRPVGDHPGDGHRRPQPAVQPGRPRAGWTATRAARRVGWSGLTRLRRRSERMVSSTATRTASPLRRAEPEQHGEDRQHIHRPPRLPAPARRRPLAARTRAAGDRARRDPGRSGPAAPASPPVRARRRCT